MKRWRSLVLGALAMFLVAAPPAEAAEESAAPVSAVNPQAERDAVRAAKAAERERLQAERAAQKEARREAIAAGKAQRTAEKEERKAAAQSAQMAQQPIAAPETAPAAAMEVASAAPASVTAAKVERQEAIAARKAERAAVMEERRAARAAEKSERRAEAAAEREAKRAARVEQAARDRRDKGSRYKTLFVDNNFTYYLDENNTRWVQRPYSSDEYMIDAWVRLVENTTGEAIAEDGKIRPARYFLEHYYISPARRQVMFLAELEVTGRPDNAVKERAYDPRNWEHLIPGSIEDELYEAITARMKSAPGQRKGLLSGTSGMSLRDMVEEFARISF